MPGRHHRGMKTRREPLCRGGLGRPAAIFTAVTNPLAAAGGTPCEQRAIFLNSPVLPARTSAGANPGPRSGDGDAKGICGSRLCLVPGALIYWAAADRLETTRTTLARLEPSEDLETRRILTVWRANLERDARIVEELGQERARRLGELDRLLHPKGDYRLLNAAGFEVLA
jgi:hypothetical protein